MNDFARRLLGRADAAPVRPLLPSRFEPVIPLRDRDLGLAGPDDGPARRPGWEAEPETVVPPTGWPSIEAATEPAPAKTRPSEKRPTEKGVAEAGFVEKEFVERGAEEPRPEEMRLAEPGPVEMRPGETVLAKKPLSAKGLAAKRPVDEGHAEPWSGKMAPAETGFAEKGLAGKQPVGQSGSVTGLSGGRGGSAARSWPVVPAESASCPAVPGEESRRVVDPETAGLPPRSGFTVEWRRPTASGEESVTPAGSSPRPVVRCPEGPLRDVQRPEGPLQGIAAAARAARQEPVVHITIGRVEVRAAAEPQPAPRRGPRRRQALGLDEYLRRKAGG